MINNIDDMQDESSGEREEFPSDAGEGIHNSAEWASRFSELHANYAKFNRGLKSGKVNAPNDYPERLEHIYRKITGFTIEYLARHPTIESLLLPVMQEFQTLTVSRSNCELRDLFFCTSIIDTISYFKNLHRGVILNHKIEELIPDFIDRVALSSNKGKFIEKFESLSPSRYDSYIQRSFSNFISSSKLNPLRERLYEALVEAIVAIHDMAPNSIKIGNLGKRNRMSSFYPSRLTRIEVLSPKDVESLLLAASEDIVQDHIAKCYGKQVYIFREQLQNLITKMLPELRGAVRIEDLQSALQAWHPLLVDDAEIDESSIGSGTWDERGANEVLDELHNSPEAVAAAITLPHQPDSRMDHAQSSPRQLRKLKAALPQLKLEIRAILILRLEDYQSRRVRTIEEIRIVLVREYDLKVAVGSVHNHHRKAMEFLKETLLTDGDPLPDIEALLAVCREDFHPAVEKTDSKPVSIH
ncbi:MAG: hypothetical protein HGA96_16605 [Desulfobulbaceae bacterium]|nr:hypothetical protein [Desulfobulbaceae bacterium]